MIVSGRPDHTPRKLARTWVKSENEFGDTLDTIKAEFQAIGLKSIRTAMRKSVSQQQFNKYYDLFKAQYSHYNSFLEYFEKQWVSQSSKTNKWAFYLSDSNALMTNNICESLNATIKRDFTNRETAFASIFSNSKRGVK